jgi:hypothetical protein
MEFDNNPERQMLVSTVCIGHKEIAFPAVFVKAMNGGMISGSSIADEAFSKRW